MSGTMVNFDKNEAHTFAAISRQMRASFQVEHIDGMELLVMLHHTAQFSAALANQLTEDLALSGARWRLLLHLFIDEEMGSTEGLTPSLLSHSQKVRKNTISSLLRGLEEQGLIRREIDPEDLRIFRIFLTPEGRELVRSTAPDMISRLNQLVSVLNREEIQQMKRLLDKLQRAFLEQYHDLDQGQNPIPTE